ncbi:GyrI-like domain-containing protein [Pseudoneobacillus sp. C159]
MLTSNHLGFQLVSKEEFKVVGMELSGPYSELSQIGPLWGKFVSRIPEISAIVNPQVSIGLTNDRPSDFTYYTAVEVSETTNVPAGMMVLTIPAATYAVFTHKGLTENLGETINNARKTIVESGYTIDHTAFWFERYDKRYNPTSAQSEFDLYFPIIK